MSELFHAVRGNRSRRYPNPPASIGDRIGMIHGQDYWWEAKGPARRDFDELIPEIKRQLESYCGAIGGSEFLIFQVYMIGRTEQTASPVIMFFCKEKGPRRDAMDVIKKSGLLKRYPGFKTGNRASPPDVTNLVQPTTTGSMRPGRFSRPPHVTNLVQPATTESISEPTEKVLYDPLQSIRAYGMQIFVENGGTPSTQIRAATANLLRHGDEILYFSVSHVFKNMADPRLAAEVSGDRESDYEIASDSSDDYNFEDEVDITSRGSVSVESVPGESSDEGTSADDSLCSEKNEKAPSALSASHSSALKQDIRIPSPLQLTGDVEASPDTNNSFLESSTWGKVPSSKPSPSTSPIPNRLAPLGFLALSSVDKDWALIRITSGEVLAAIATLDGKDTDGGPLRVKSESCATNIVTFTSSRRILGNIAEAPLYMQIPGGKSFQEVYKVQLNGFLANGDCGSWVVDAKNGDLYGYVVAGCENNGVVYAMAAYHALQDMQTHFGPPLLQLWQSRFRKPDVPPIPLLKAPNVMVDPGSPILSSMSESGASFQSISDSWTSLQDMSSSGPSSISSEADDGASPFAKPLPDPTMDLSNQSTSFRHIAPQSPFFHQSSGSFVAPLGSSYPSLIQPYGQPPFTSLPYARTMETSSKNELLPPSPSPSDASIRSTQHPGSRQFRSSGSPFLRTVSYQPYPQYPGSRRPSTTCDASRRSGRTAESDIIEDEGKMNSLCPIPGCGRTFEDLKAHLLTHRTERPEKCPIPTCEYHEKGFTRRYDRDRHALTHYKGAMLCGFCPGSDSTTTKIFNRVDVFKRHLSSVHGAEHVPPNSRKKSSVIVQSSHNNSAGTCSVCSVTFANPQELYDHLGDCVLRVIQQDNHSEAINKR